MSEVQLVIICNLLKKSQVLQKRLPVNTPFKPMAQNSLLMTTPVSRRHDKVLLHQETDHAHFYRKIRISTRKTIASFMLFIPVDY